MPLQAPATRYSRVIRFIRVSPSSDAQRELARAVAEALQFRVPCLCMSDSMTFAIGVPSGALRCMLPSSVPLPWPSRRSGQRRWLWRLPSAIGEP